MSYATYAELTASYAKQFLIRISNFVDENPFDSIQEDNCQKALDDASALIDGYLMGRYATPIAPAPAYFKPDTMAIAVGLLIERKGFVPDTADASAVTNKDNILKKYFSISEGKIDLVIPSGGATVPASNVISSAPDKVFTSELLDKY
jgi:phage gp36-like protein